MPNVPSGHADEPAAVAPVLTRPHLRDRVARRDLVRREGWQAMSAALIRRCLTLLADSAGQCAQVQAVARAHVLEEARKAGLS